MPNLSILLEGSLPRSPLAEMSPVNAQELRSKLDDLVDPSGESPINSSASSAASSRSCLSHLALHLTLNLGLILHHHHQHHHHHYDHHPHLLSLQPSRLIRSSWIHSILSPPLPTTTPSAKLDNDGIAITTTTISLSTLPSEEGSPLIVPPQGSRQRHHRPALDPYRDSQSHCLYFRVSPTKAHLLPTAKDRLRHFPCLNLPP
ncbi:hypothetical protein BC829DRAFT_135779 [Chytridium lagenaria]|nr:hypothetical protein BC829DRAFT_135779 [Chytridium lagenaria]